MRQIYGMCALPTVYTQALRCISNAYTYAIPTVYTQYLHTQYPRCIRNPYIRNTHGVYAFHTAFAHSTRYVRICRDSQRHIRGWRCCCVGISFALLWTARRRRCGAS